MAALLPALVLMSPVTGFASDVDEPAREHWAFRALRDVEPPALEDDDWSRTPIDRFILARLREAKLAPNASADRRTLLRRVSFDLIGLAPDRDEIEAFLADASPESWDKVVSQLLSSPHHGERWGRHWLDVARFGESHGYESDDERPSAWTFRDAVIRAIDEDLPFDRFVRWQIAGDTLGEGDPLASALTGFLTAGSTVTNVDGVDREKARYDKLDDIVSATGSALLGLTIGCARCHDHKFDPIAQRDYYRLVGFFVPGTPADRDLSLRPEGSDKALVWNGGSHRASPLLERGDPERKGEDVGTGVLPALGAADGDLSRWLEPGDDPRGDRRPALARWLTDLESGAGALVARVIVNRVWQHHFGVGLVPSSNNFGRIGDRPSHPELLDWLAGELVRGGWRLKHLHRLILSSSVYRQSTAWDPARHAIDPGNRLLWRRRPRRVEAEVLRDAILNTAGTLNRELHGPSVKPWVSRDAIETGSTRKWPTDVVDGPATWRRSVYIFLRRSMRVPFLEIFDTPDSMQSRGRREETTVATQALLLLNNPFVRDQAKRFAARVLNSAGGDARAAVEEAYWLALSRGPEAAELELGLSLLRASPETDASPAITAEGVESLCHLLFTLNEFAYVD